MPSDEHTPDREYPPRSWRYPEFVRPAPPRSRWRLALAVFAVLVIVFTLVAALIP